MSLEEANTSITKEEMSEYEKGICENIRELHTEYTEVFENVKESVENLTEITSTSKDNDGQKRRRNAQHWRHVKMGSIKPEKTIKNVEAVRRSERLKDETKYKKINYNEGEDFDRYKKKKMRRRTSLIKFPWAKNKKVQNKDNYNLFCDNDFINSDDDEDELENGGAPRFKKLRTDPTARLPVSQVTQKMLDNIIYYSSKKKYNELGTTCHQCRQKTLDQKSYCRYKGCKGARGMFCGFCLGKRYGEDVADALKNPKWACPPCRGHCNCSICRRKLGLHPTGQLAQQAIYSGFKSVRHMLCHFEGEVSDKAENGQDGDVEKTERDVLQGEGGAKLVENGVQGDDTVKTGHGVAGDGEDADEKTESIEREPDNKD